MNMIIPFIVPFFAACFLRETKSIFDVLWGVSNVIDFNGKKRKKNKEYDQTRFVFYIRWAATM